MNQEKRIIESTIEIRQEENNQSVIVGYALKFNRNSEQLGYFTPFIERLDSNCLDDTDMTNVVALINHDSNYPLARSGVNLTLTVDEIGLKFKMTPTNTSYAHDLIENMRSGVINKCSFAFTLPDEDGAEKWEKQSDSDVYIRTIYKIDKLYDISIVTSPAYEDTEAVLGKRSQELVNQTTEYERLKLIVDSCR